MTVTAIPKFERFFREIAGLDVDKEDLRRYGEFVNERIADLLIRSQATAKANGRDIVEPYDLPITKGLRQCMQEFERLDRSLGLAPIIDQLTNRPQLDFAYTEETDRELPRVAGGLSVALARSFTIVDPKLKNPRSEHWERSFRLFTLLL